MTKPFIEIPVNAAVKKFLEAKIGSNYTLAVDDWFGIILSNFLLHKTSKHFKIYPKYRGNIPIKFKVFISQNQAEKVGIGLTEKQEISLNNLVEKIFRDEMYYSAIVNKKLFNVDYRITINNVLDSYDITEDDLSFDTIIKDFDRKKDSIIPKLFI